MPVAAGVLAVVDEPVAVGVFLLALFAGVFLADAGGGHTRAGRRRVRASMVVRRFGVMLGGVLIVRGLVLCGCFSSYCCSFHLGHLLCWLCGRSFCWCPSFLGQFFPGWRSFLLAFHEFLDHAVAAVVFAGSRREIVC